MFIIIIFDYSCHKHLALKICIFLLKLISILLATVVTISVSFTVTAYGFNDDKALTDNASLLIG